MAGTTERERHRRSRPGEDGLRRLAAALDADTARVVRRLGGGLGSATHLIALGDHRVVLKRYPVDSSLPAVEWECLAFAHTSGLLAPEPLALDQDGVWFGSPALVIEVMPGQPDLAPLDAKTYVDDAATALARLHAAPTDGAGGALLRPHAVEEWKPPEVVPDGLIAREVAPRVVEAIVQWMPIADRGGAVLNHGDFHPGNLLWRRGRLSGIIDWSHARVGPRWWELEYFRMEVAVLVDVRAADVVLDRYQTLLGNESPHQAVWDLLCLYNGHRWGHFWLTGYREQGRRDLTLETMRRRLTRLARRALASLDA